MVVNRLIRSGVDLNTAASLTGHSVMTMLKAYRSPSEWERDQAVRQAKLSSFAPERRVIQGPWKSDDSDDDGGEQTG